MKHLLVLLGLLGSLVFLAPFVQNPIYAEGENAHCEWDAVVGTTDYTCRVVESETLTEIKKEDVKGLKGCYFKAETEKRYACYVNPLVSSSSCNVSGLTKSATNLCQAPASPTPTGIGTIKIIIDGAPVWPFKCGVGASNPGSYPASNPKPDIYLVRPECKDSPIDSCANKIPIEVVEEKVKGKDCNSYWHAVPKNVPAGDYYVRIFPNREGRDHGYAPENDCRKVTVPAGGEVSTTQVIRGSCEVPNRFYYCYDGGNPPCVGGHKCEPYACGASAPPPPPAVCNWCTNRNECNSHPGYSFTEDYDTGSGGWCNQTNDGLCCGSSQAIPTHPPSALTTPPPSTSTCGNICHYSQVDSVSGVTKCYEGNCLDRSQNCGFNQNCGFVEKCSSGREINCQTGAPITTTPIPGICPEGQQCVYLSDCPEGKNRGPSDTCQGFVGTDYQTCCERSSPTATIADLNSDGVINLNDWSLANANYGGITSSGVSINALTLSEILSNLGKKVK